MPAQNRTNRSRLIAIAIASASALAGALLVAAPAQAAPTSYTDGAGVKYSYDTGVDPTEATVTGYAGPTGADIVIPSTIIDLGHEYPVVAVGVDAFRNKDIHSVDIAGSVKSIGSSAFNSSNLSTAIFHDGLTTIKDGAFYFNKLASVEVPDTVTTMENSAFAANRITSLKISKNLPSLDYGVFASNSLTAVEIPANIQSILKSALSNQAASVAPYAPTLLSVRFLGAAPTIFGDASDIEPSFDPTSSSLVLHYPASQGGYGNPTWHGYTTMKGLAPFITGVQREGNVLFANPGSVIPSVTALSYQWYANGAPIGGANGSALGLGGSQAGRQISVVVAATSPGPDVEAAGTSATGIISSPLKRLVLSSYAVHRGQGFTVAATGLKPNQKYKIQLNKKTRASGRADANGTVYRAVSFKSNTKSGNRTVKVTGSKAKHVKKYSASTKIRYYK